MRSNRTCVNILLLFDLRNCSTSILGKERWGWVGEDRAGKCWLALETETAAGLMRVFATSHTGG